MDEYEALEEELGGVYAAYIEKFRNLTYLEQVNKELNKVGVYYLFVASKSRAMVLLLLY